MTLGSIDSYKASQRNYALFSGVLLLWDIVGIEVNPTLVTTINIHIVRRDATQYIMIGLLAYFRIRFTIERIYIKLIKMSSGIESLDFFTSHCLGGFALVMWLSTRKNLEFNIIVGGFSLAAVAIAIISIAIRVHSWRKISKEMNLSISRIHLDVAMTKRIAMSSWTLTCSFILIFSLEIHLHSEEEYVIFLVSFIIGFALFAMAYLAPERSWDSPINHQAISDIENRIASQVDENDKKKIEDKLRIDLAREYGLLGRLCIRLRLGAIRASASHSNADVTTAS